MDALIVHGDLFSFLSKAFGLQASTHSSQNRHSPAEKSIAGKLARAGLMMCVGHCEMQSPQLLQISLNSCSSIAHGGRSGDSFPLKSPRRNCILLTCALIKTAWTKKQWIQCKERDEYVHDLYQVGLVLE
jgi:hypothetical protein